MKECIKNLLSINRNAFRFLHDAEGFDFEKPYFITEQAGKFTVNTVTKAVQAELKPAKCKIVVFVVPTKESNDNYLYYATLSGGRFDGTRKAGADYWKYRTKDGSGNIDYRYGIGNFEELRKNHTEKIFIIAQDKANTAAPQKKSIDFSARYTLIDARKHGDGRGNTYIGKLNIEATDGSGARFEYEPYNTFYGYEVKSANIADFIDNSGYLLRPLRLDLMRRAEQLRRERKRAEADNADFTEATAELQTLIDKARAVLSDSVMACNDPDTAGELSKKMASFSRALSYFADYNNKLASKKYASIDNVKSDIDIIKEKLNYCIA